MVTIQNAVDIRTAFAAGFCPLPDISDRLRMTFAEGQQKRINIVAFMTYEIGIQLTHR